MKFTVEGHRLNKRPIPINRTIKVFLSPLCYHYITKDLFTIVTFTQYMMSPFKIITRYDSESESDGRNVGIKI